MVFVALPCTSAPDCTTMFALSDSAMALLLPTTTCALGPTVTWEPDASVGPAPIIVVHGDGEVVSQVVVVPDVVQFA
ncbi:hypothetical protein JCM10599A_30440 [Paraburkholderia kururiensis]